MRRRDRQPSVPWRTVAGVFGVGLLIAGCSTGTAGESGTSQAAGFGAREVPCEETVTFSSLGCCEAQAGQVLVQQCWAVESPTDIAQLITDIRDLFAPDQDPEDRTAAQCQTWSGRAVVSECAIGGVVSDEPYTVVGVTARPAFSSEELTAVLDGADVDAKIVEVYIRVTELGSSIDQWVSDQSGTHID